MTVSVRIDIFSDIVCPWCLIGWERLKRALATLDTEVAADIHWLPFELNPDMPAAGVDRSTYLDAKFGPARAAEITERLQSVAAADAIEMRLDLVSRQPNTFAAHRMIHWAEQQGAGTAMKEALLRAHFVEGAFVGDVDVLARIAEAIGLDGEMARQVAASEAHGAEVRALEARARELGIQGVPFFILDRKLALSGAQPPEIMVDAIREAVRARVAA